MENPAKQKDRFAALVIHSRTLPHPKLGNARETFICVAGSPWTRDLQSDPIISHVAHLDALKLDANKFGVTYGCPHCGTKWWSEELPA
jgi:hypothetical protein